MPSSGSQVTELKDLEVHEVSLVDAPAIRRKFLIIKNEEPNMSDAPGEEIVEAAASEPTPEVEPTEDAVVNKDEGEEEVQQAPEEDAAEEPAAVSADEEVAEESPEEDAAEETPEEVVEESPEEEAVEKAAKRVTSGRYERMLKLYNEMGTLIKELSPSAAESAPHEGDKTPAVKAESIETIVQKAVEAAIAPLLKSAEPEEAGNVSEVTKSETPSTEDAATEDAKDTDPASDEVEGLRKRLSQLEGTSSAGVSDVTDTPVTKSKPFWNGIV